MQSLHSASVELPSAASFRILFRVEALRSKCDGMRSLNSSSFQSTNTLRYNQPCLRFLTRSVFGTPDFQTCRVIEPLPHSRRGFKLGFSGEASGSESPSALKLMPTTLSLSLKLERLGLKLKGLYTRKPTRIVLKPWTEEVPALHRRLSWASCVLDAKGLR